MCQVQGCFSVARVTRGEIQVCDRCNEELMAVHKKSDDVGLSLLAVALGVIVVIGLRYLFM